MKVLSLFDGIACGAVALNRVGIPIEKYDAFEIDQNAIKVATSNNPYIVEHGDVFDADFTEFRGYDLLIGGSPCTYWSCVNQTGNKEITPDRQGGKLFMEYVRALKESRCKWFLYENNYSIASNIKDFISEQLSVKPVTIDSAGFSAQSRKRCYWTNIPVKGYWVDKKTELSNVIGREVFGCALRGRDNPDGTRTQHLEVRRDKKSNCITTVGKDCMFCRKATEFDRSKEKEIYEVFMGKVVNKGCEYKVSLPDGDYIVERPTPEETELLQTLPEGYTKEISKTQRYKCIGNGWIVDVIVHLLQRLKEFL